jgi:hypothetical protein
LVVILSYHENGTNDIMPAGHARRNVSQSRKARVQPREDRDYPVKTG